MLTFEYAKNPVYGNAEETHINLLVKFKEFEIEIPFGANAWDPHEHGQTIYERAQAGEFGTIAPFVLPTVLQQEV
jgi:hypothetical protein